MVDQAGLGGGACVSVGREEEEDEFCSCCEDVDGEEEEVWKETEEPVVVVEELKDELDEFSVNMFFKGLSVAGVENSLSGLSGIGVVMERSSGFPAIRVQKRLDFYAEESLVEYLALMDGLREAIQHKIRRVYAFTDSELLYVQITNEQNLEMPLLMALRERILEHANNFEAFVLKLVPSTDLEQPLQLAKVAIGLVTFPVNGAVMSSAILVELSTGTANRHVNVHIGTKTAMKTQWQTLSKNLSNVHGRLSIRSP